MKGLLNFVKNEAVLCAAALLAVISIAFMPIDSQYIDYIDYKVICVLFCLMTVVAGLRALGVFDVLAQNVVEKCNGRKSLAFMLIALCFFSSMFITNDVSLITFVPLALTALAGAEGSFVVFVIVMQTIAANLGSMLTPVGNPQNLYLFTAYSLGIGEFFMAVLPIGVLGLLLILGAWFFWVKDQKIISDGSLSKAQIKSKKIALIYGLLFVICFLSVFNIIPYYITLVIVVAVVFAMDKKLFKMVDYSLLFTFAAFFIFVGNICRIDYIHSFISSAVKGNEFISSVVLSQIISNVPAALMLSGFTDNAVSLLRGTNAGGLGTIIASMASLISYRLYVKSENSDKKRFFNVFSLYNVLFLVIIVCFCYIFSIL